MNSWLLILTHRRCKVANMHARDPKSTTGQSEAAE